MLGPIFHATKTRITSLSSTAPHLQTASGQISSKAAETADEITAWIAKRSDRNLASWEVHLFGRRPENKHGAVSRGLEKKRPLQQWQPITKWWIPTATEGPKKGHQRKTRPCDSRDSNRRLLFHRRKGIRLQPRAFTTWCASTGMST